MRLKLLAILLIMTSLVSPAYADNKTLITLTIGSSSSGGENDGTYVLVIPEALSPTTSGWTAFDGGITAKASGDLTFNTSSKLVVTATSGNTWRLVLSPDKTSSVGYTLASKDDGGENLTWEFSASEINTDGGTSKPAGVIIEDYTGNPAGSYVDTVTFKAEVQDADTASAGKTVTLTADTGEVTLEDGDTLTGTGGANTHIMIAKGATITLKDVDITSIPGDDEDDDNPLCPWAGITPLGDATIILEGTNEVKGGNGFYPGIFAAVNSTLTIRGTGKLTASSNGYAPGIGGGYSIACGNIVIAGGNITATGGYDAAGIGGCYEASCGTITISGGTITAEGGQNAAGIGSGTQASCGDITITSGVTSVTATKGSGAPASIGSSWDGSCGTVTIDPNANVTQN